MIWAPGTDAIIGRALVATSSWLTVRSDQGLRRMTLKAWWVFGMPFGFMAIVGTMGLIGVAINDSIVVLAAIRENERARGGDGEEFGEQRLIDLVRRHRATGAGVLRDLLVAAVEDFTGGRAQDDLTLVVLAAGHGD